MATSQFLARIVDVSGDLRIVPLFLDLPPSAFMPAEGGPSFEVNSVVLCEHVESEPRIVCVLAEPGTARADLYAILVEAHLDPIFPSDVMAETASLLASPSIDDPRLVDLTHLPFVTIDAPTSRDLDQALFIERLSDVSSTSVYRVHYALADAAHFVPPRSALFREALRRGASYYLPGISVSMLPRELSEGIVSLNEGVDRRALTFSMDLDARGGRVSTTVNRARIRSRKKLSFGEVQALYDTPETSALTKTELAESLLLLREVGLVLMRDASSRNVVRYARREVDVGLSSDGKTFAMSLEKRAATELYNEQISLLCNSEGARLLLEGASPDVQAIFRVHPAPDEARLALFSLLTRAVAESHGLDVSSWAFRATAPSETLSDYLSRLPTDPPDGATVGADHRVARALQRQAILVNVKSTFAASPARHFGVGADVYARFSAPMREVVGVFVHKEMVELEGARGGLVGAPPTEQREVDEALRREVVDSANRAKDTQRRVNDLSNRRVIDRLFREDLAQSIELRPRRTGTVMGITQSKVHVALDMPPIDVKLYVRDLGKARGGAWLELRKDGVELFDPQASSVVARLGDRVALFVERRDDAQDRWVLLPESIPEGA